jgi:hypothetical protein
MGPSLIHIEHARAAQAERRHAAPRPVRSRPRLVALPAVLAVALVVFAFAVVASAASARPIREATIAPAATASTPRPVTFDLHGLLTGPSTIAGDWQAVGAVSDSGTYTESFRFAGGTRSMPRTVHTSKTLVGADGTLQLRAEAVVVWQSPTLATFKGGNWRITSGSGAYSDLHAGGTPGVTPETFGDLATGVVHMVHVGQAH